MKEKSNLDYYECGATLTFCEINADGTMAPCTLCRTCIPANKLTFENIRDQKIITIRNGKLFNEIRNFMTTGCSGCKAFTKCNKCIAQSFRYFGNGTSPTPYCLRNGENLCIENLNHYRKILSEF